VFKNGNPLSMIVRAQQSRTFRWLLGLKGFSLAPVREDDNPLRRIQLRLLTTLEGLLALAFTLLSLLVAAVAGLISGSARPAGWVLLVGSMVALILVGRSLWRSRRGAMPDPGVLYITAALNLAAVAAAIAVFWKSAPNGP